MSKADTLAAMMQESMVHSVQSAQRTIETITSEILELKKQAGKALLGIGQRLIEAKETLPHGEWLPWLTERVEFSERTAQYGELIFTDQEIQEGETYEAAALLSDALEIGTFQMELYLRDESKGAALTSFRRNDKLLYYHRERLQGTYYIESVERTGKFTYTVTANNALALLDQSDHMGGIYTGQTVEELVAEICNIPYQVQTKFAKVKLYGWLPVATRRANLAQVLFAVGAQAKVDQIGTLRIEALWDGVSSAITPDRVFWGDKVRYEAQVTEVSVLEHQYIPGTEEIQLFEGTTQSGDVIQFQEPVHSLAASGFSLLEQGANYAKVSAGTGTLTGKKYVHTTRDVRQAVTPDDVANVVEVKEATLVSLVNSAAVAERLAEYYKWIEAMEATVVYDGERPGDVIAFEHPFGGASVGCVKSASITIGGRLVAQETTAIGYRPPLFTQTEILDGRVLIDADTAWTVPDGVTSVRAVLIGGGDGGGSGASGQAGGSAGENRAGTGGKAGRYGGKAGDPGKVLETTLDVTPGEQIQVRIGAAGTPNGKGGDTTFGDLTSADGVPPVSGYTDPVTGETFAIKGWDGNSEGVDGEPGTTGGVTLTVSLDGTKSNVLGQGGKRGSANGSTAEWYASATYNRSGTNYYVSFHAASGLDGKDGRDGSNARTYGSSGSGGSVGNGGSGAGGYTVTIKVGDRLFPTGSSYLVNGITRNAADGGRGGRGGSGGYGASGCVILYYGIPKKQISGPVQDKNARRLLDRLGRRIIV